MNDIKLAPEILAEAARMVDTAAREMEAAIPQLPFGIDDFIDNAIEDMRNNIVGNPEATGIALPVYRQMMRVGALIAIDAMTEKGVEP